MLKKGDIILIAVLIPVIVASIYGIRFFRYDGPDKIAVIKQNEKEIKRIDLNKVSKTERIKIDGKYHETILIESGRIRFEDADCPDRLCVKTGWLSKSGDMSVCLPNYTIIKIEGNSDKVDGVAY